MNTSAQKTEVPRSNFRKCAKHGLYTFDMFTGSEVGSAHCKFFVFAKVLGAIRSSH